MPYTCSITDDNKVIYEYRIYELINVFNMCHSESVLQLVIVLITEYLFAMAFVNTRNMVSAKAAFATMGLERGERNLLNVMKQFRDAVVHAPNTLSYGLMRSLRNASVPGNLKYVVQYFEDKETVAKFFKWIHENYAVYLNIAKYRTVMNMTEESFDADKARLMKVLHAYTDKELDEKIVALL